MLRVCCPRCMFSLRSLPFRLQRASTWTSTGLTGRHGVLQAVGEMGLSSPTPVQQDAVPKVLGGEDVLFLGQTGSGKTLAFLAPVVQLLKEEEVEKGVATRPGRPRALVLCPSRELALQIRRVVKQLSHHAKISSVCVTSGVPRARQLPALQGRVDVMVATPGRLLRYLKQGDVRTSDVKYVVIDEADTMVVDFEPELRQILGPIEKAMRRQRDDDGTDDVVFIGDASTSTSTSTTSTSTIGDDSDDDAPKVQFVLAAATLAGPIRDSLPKLLPFTDFSIVKSAGSHAVPASLSVTHLPVSGEPTAKHDALATLLDPPPSHRTLIFCNSVASCRSLGHFLGDRQVPHASLHGDIPQRRRELEFSRFRDGLCPTLVCTDAAARGLDFEDVQHVIMFDFPRDAPTYLHRAGRTGRAGATGAVTALVKRRDTALARRIKASIDLQEPLMGKSSASASSSSGHHKKPTTRDPITRPTRRKLGRGATPFSSRKRRSGGGGGGGGGNIRRGKR